MAKKLCSVVFSVVLLSQFAGAQVITGKISGVVHDSTGAIAPGVTIIIKNVETGIVRSVTTDDRGRYQAPNLSVGTYSVQAELSGFQTAIRNGIELTVGREAVLEFTLQVGGVAEKVEVTAEAPLVNTTSATVAALVEGKTIADLPLNGRNFVQLATLQPGVNPMLTNSDPGLSIAGGRSTQNNFLLDGMTTNGEQNKTPVSQSGEVLGVEAIREFSVLTSNYSAEYGRGGGGIINAVTKSGTNQIHGSVFEFLRNDNLDAADFFDNASGNTKPEFKRNQFGFSLGGPLAQNRAFYFGTYEGLRQVRGTTELPRTPGAQIRQGFAPTPGRRGEFTFVGVAEAIRPYLNLYPLPNSELSEDGTGEFSYTNVKPTREDFFQIRVDHHLGANDSLFGRYTQSYSTYHESLSLPQFLANKDQRNQYLALEESKIFSPTVLNIFRFGVNRSAPTFVPASPDVDPKLSFVPGQPFGGISVTGLAQLASGSSPYKNQFQTTFMFLDNVSWVRGKHSLKFGGYMERIQDNIQEFTRRAGVYSFESIREFLQNQPSRFEIAPPGDDLTRGIRQRLIAWFVQDDIQFSPSFTFNLGLRHEFFTTPMEVNGKTPNIRDIFSSNPVFVGDPFLKNPSYRDFAPRVGFAWSPFGDGKTSVRSGFGFYFDPILAYHVDNTFTNMPPFSRRARINTPPFPNGLDVLGGASFLFLPKSTEFAPSSSYTMRWNLTVEREIATETVVSAGYIGSRGVHLSHLRDINEALPTSVGSDGREFRVARAPRRNLAFAEVRQTAFDSSSHYHSLQLNLKRRFRRGFQFQTAYTFAKSVDTASSGGAKREFTQSTSIATTPLNINFDRGLSNFDVRHISVSNFSLELPFGHGRRYFSQRSGLPGRLVEGWRIQGILSLSSGIPVTPRVGFDRDNNDETDADRPDLLPGTSNNPVLGGPINYFDGSSFALPTAGFRGNLGRNTVIGPGLADFDFSLFKNTAISELVSVQFRAEAFNLFNHANFAPPPFPALFDSTGRRLPNPGRITSTLTSSRQLQFGLKLIW